MTTERQIIFHRHYFQDFYVAQNEKVREKIGYVFRIVKTVEKIPEKFLKHLEGTDGLYEIRVEVGSDIFRMICSFDKGNVVVLFNAFQKKSQKTPKREIALAGKLKKEYISLKIKRNEKNRSDKKNKKF
ncbi:MAG: type II toxin-antitoxin system RelE/ParE family toxin [bacterium]